MARTGAPPIPPIAHDVVESFAVPPTPREVSSFELIVRETHTAALEADAHARDLWSGVVGKLPRVPSNTGVRSLKGPNDCRPTKLRVLGAAVALFPYLINKVEGQSRMGKITHKYRFRQLYVDRYESILSRLAVEAEAPEAEVFGAWADWGGSWAADRESRFAGDLPPRVGETWSGEVQKVCEVVNIEGLRAYASLGKDRRPAQLAEFISFHEKFGETCMGGGSKAAQKYARKIIRGREMGRLYAQDVSMQTITKEARLAACMDGYLELDITKCFPCCILHLYPDRDIRAVRKYVQYTSFWRRAAADYYDINMDEAKEVLTCAMYGFPTPRNIISPSPHTLPFVKWLTEDSRCVREEICKSDPDLLTNFVKHNRTNAESTAFFYHVSQMEQEILTELVKARFRFFLTRHRRGVL